MSVADFVHLDRKHGTVFLDCGSKLAEVGETLVCVVICFHFFTSFCC